MDEELKSVYRHMLRLGCGALAHANWHAHYHSMDNDCWSELSVIQAAHAAEILIKARIAQEHPLLIFEDLPKPVKADARKLNLRDLIENGRTYQYSDLPDRLWATTGIKLPEIELFKSFGRLRNAVQHFTTPDDRNTSQEALEFIYKVIDPFINMCWDLHAVDFNEDNEPYVYFVPGLVRRHIEFLVSPEVPKHMEWMDFKWPDEDAAYKKLMLERFERAKSGSL